MPKAPRSHQQSDLENPFKTVTTPATLYNREIGFAVKVSMSQDKVPRLPIKGMTYKAAAICQTRMSEFKDYVCTSIPEGQSGDFILVYFSKPKSATEAMVSFFTHTPSMQNLYWPPILLKIDIVRSKIPRTVNTGDSIYRGFTYTATPTFIPSADTGTLYIQHEYLGSSEYNIPQYPTPLASAVNFPLPGSSPFQFNECLHGPISVDQLTDSYDIYATVGGAVTSNVGVVGRYSKPATDFETWLPFILTARQNRTAAGSYHLVETEVIPPPLPDGERG